MDKPTFADLGLSPVSLKAVEALGFEEPSPIQAAAIPLLMEGLDIVGQSQTGSGKTAAFAVPAIERVDAASRATQVLILCPTRELATQVADEVHKLAAGRRSLHAVPIYGGASYDRQFFELKKGAQIVIGTPGRVMDHLERGTLKLDGLKMAVLDEADRMLDMGFRDDIQQILEQAPAERQTVFFSATMPPAIRELIRRHAKDPRTVRIEPREVSAPAIEQWFYEVPPRGKFEALVRLVDYHGFKLGIVFCNTQRMVDELADGLAARGFSADRLHGGMAQAQRTRVMNKFKKAEFEFLVATDVAARGIDVDDLELVVNYDLPYDAEDYVHRIGRTGRAGRRGMAVTFVTGREIYKLQFIERFTRAKIRRGRLPSGEELAGRKADLLLDRVRTVLASGAHAAHAAMVDRLLEEGANSTDLAAALLHLLTGGGEVKAPKSGKEARPLPPPMAPETGESSAVRRPPRREQRMPRGEEAGPVVEEAVPPLRPASRGLAWIRVGAGKQEGWGPRDVVDVLAEACGLEARTVGIIEMGDAVSYAQVPESFARSLGREGGTAEWKNASVAICPLPRQSPSRAYRPRPPK